MIANSPETPQLAVFIDFENLALWAEDENVELKITQLMEYLTGRGTVIVRRAYGDFGRFSRYRVELMDNSIDMIQIFSFRSGKNLADIRMVVDAMEMVGSRPHINLFVVVSGDSDFTPLIARLREYGRYTIGIGPRKITHPLLVKGCDEFVYLETILGKAQTGDEKTAQMDRVAARVLLRKAIQAHGQRGDLPVYASKLKHTLLSMNPAFNEANFGYAQFKNWLEDNTDIVRISLKDMQLYVAPSDFPLPPDQTLLNSESAVGQGSAPASPPTSLTTPPPSPKTTTEVSGNPSTPSLREQYVKTFNRLKMLLVPRDQRRTILKSIYELIQQNPAGKTADQIMEELTSLYEKPMGISKAGLKQIWQMAFRQRAFDFKDKSVSVHAPVQIQAEILTPDSFIARAEGSFVYAVLYEDLPIQTSLLAEIVCENPEDSFYIERLIADLLNRKIISQAGAGFVINRETRLEFLNEHPFKEIKEDLARCKVPTEFQNNGKGAAELARLGKIHQQKKDYPNAAQYYLQAARALLDSVDHPDEPAILEDLRYYLASYASSQAGHLYQNEKNYAASRPYYLAFFAFFRENSPLWNSLKRLIDPLLSYYWASGVREMGIDINEWGVKSSDPVDIAIKAARHENPIIRKQWQILTRDLAQANPVLLNYIVSQMRDRIS